MTRMFSTIAELRAVTAKLREIAEHTFELDPDFIEACWEQIDTLERLADDNETERYRK